MKRMLWFSLGIAAGVAATRKVRGALYRVSPAGAAENVSDAVRELAAAVGSFGAEVKAGMLQREAELHATVAQLTGMDLTPGHASSRARATSART